ncbi:LacI family DNA-binding transcriptional regulator [Aliiglaciecola sp. CAU 1673]|uniref:LacI family DNA-binding transcriptional regulator n=1 Tax=Aliiglaciecola sp. CAU 1673 TaxID=3032595 RepID=UPI0023DC0DC8|nr:LacI family DNA-binding transcriptional regulator [Aliiglaciecola sp. CAU 1673]MDF2178812.1 LacI family DNA-binding transcriptional regulator [Aliiglaciecola sp. CAU 1673]
MATIYEVSALAGVSLATVSRVMNGNANVRESTKQKVLEAMATLDYRPSSVAQSLASNCTNSVGLLVSELHGPFYGTMMASIESELRRAGKHCIITAGHSEEKSEKAGIEFLLSRNCDALILHVEKLSDEYLLALKEKDISFVLINRQIDAIAEQCVTLDNHLGGYQMGQAILEAGHQKIAYLAGPSWKDDAKERFAGFKQALEEKGVELDPALIFEGNFQEASGYKGARELLLSGHEFTALCCANDEMAAGAMNAIRDNGLDIPNDVSVVGFDNVSFTQYLFPRLTTIDYPVGDMGQMAARLILKNTYKTTTSTIQTLFKPHLVKRQSLQPQE